MLLDDALFGQITTALAGDAAAPAATAVAGQRRREPRVGVNATVTVIPVSDGLRIMPFDVPVRDLSAGGIGFLHSDRIGLNEQFAVLLPEGGESVAVLCEVAHYQRLAEREYAIGARFVRVLRRAAGPASVPLPTVAPAARRAAS
jgi:c-di-GMP-binding flagellar brake protein YcgR